MLSVSTWPGQNRWHQRAYEKLHLQPCGNAGATPPVHQDATLWPGCTCLQKQHGDAPRVTTYALLGLRYQELTARQSQQWRHCAFMSMPSVALTSTHIPCAWLPMALAAATRPRLPQFRRHRKMPWDVPVPEAARSPAPALSRRQKVYLQRNRGNEARSCAGSWRHAYGACASATGQGHASRGNGGTPHNGQAIASTMMPLVRWRVGTLHRIAATYTAPPKTDLRGRTAWRHAASRQQGFEW